ncbi:MAG TPA: preprotein translocase subunit SecG [Stellaceae bacterium]
MIAVITVVHIFLAVALVAVIMLQKSEGGALGIGGGGMSGFMTGRSTANLLTRTTAGIAVVFFLTSLALAMLAGHGRVAHSVVEGPIPSAPVKSAPASPAPAKPAPPPAPATPSAPLAK